MFKDCNVQCPICTDEIRIKFDIIKLSISSSYIKVIDIFDQIVCTM